MRFSSRVISAASREISFLAIYTSIKHFGLRSCLFAGLVLAGVSAISALALVVVLLVRVLCTPRKLVPLCDEKQTVLGKPLFFPSTITHSRLSPVRNQFTYRLLLIGVPIGLRCRVGNLLNIDQEHPHQNNENRRPLFEWASWFSFDSERYLHKGDSQLYLQEKLQRFLRDQVSLTLILIEWRISRAYVFHRMKIRASGRLLIWSACLNFYGGHGVL